MGECGYEMGELSVELCDFVWCLVLECGVDYLVIGIYEVVVYLVFGFCEVYFDCVVGVDVFDDVLCGEV